MWVVPLLLAHELATLAVPAVWLAQVREQQDWKSRSQRHEPHDTNNSLGMAFAHSRFERPHYGHVSVNTDCHKGVGAHED